MKYKNIINVEITKKGKLVESLVALMYYDTKAKCDRDWLLFFSRHLKFNYCDEIMIPIATLEELGIEKVDESNFDEVLKNPRVCSDYEYKLMRELVEDEEKEWTWENVRDLEMIEADSVFIYQLNIDDACRDWEDDPSLFIGEQIKMFEKLGKDYDVIIDLGTNFYINSKWHSATWSLKSGKIRLDDGRYIVDIPHEELKNVAYYNDWFDRLNEGENIVPEISSKYGYKQEYKTMDELAIDEDGEYFMLVTNDETKARGFDENYVEIFLDFIEPLCGRNNIRFC